ncbi:hypothetical protein [Mucilaginibacter antarcticus]|uniref:hypothetical protein n=1 Tax=Mucilaginibacter antarcticus TaxID=1855725 RepID=UPI0036281F85
MISSKRSFARLPFLLSLFYDQPLSPFRLSCFAGVFIAVASITSGATAQTYQPFTSGLSIRTTANYNRAALYQDQIAYAINKGTLTVAEEGMGITGAKAGTDAKWTKVTADTANRFRMRGGEGNYTYFAYDLPAERAAILNIQGNSAVYVNGEPHMGDPYRFGWMNVVVKLKKAATIFLFVVGCCREV